MKKVLLLDTNLAALPIYDYLISLNYDVFVVGGNENDFLAKYAKKYLKFNYSNIKELIKNIKKYNISYIIPGCNDVSYFCCAKVNEIFSFSKNIDSYKVTEILNNKKSFKEFAEINKISVPAILNNKDKSKYIIIKPADSYSGKGNTIVYSSNHKNIELAKKNAIKNSKIGQYLIEEYVKGQLYSHTAFLSSGKFFQDFIVKEYCIANPYAVDTSYCCHKFNKNIIRKEINKIIKKLNIKEGLIHTQFIKTRNSIKILEITRRCPGDLYNLLIEKSTKFNYVKAYVDPFLNKKYKNTIKNSLKYQNIIRHTITSVNDLSFKYLSFKSNINNLDFFILNKSGEFLQSAPKSRIGIIFLKSNKKDFIKRVNTLLKRAFYSIK